MEKTARPGHTRVSKDLHRLNLLHETSHRLVHEGLADLPRRVILRLRAMKLDLELYLVRLRAKNGDLEILRRAQPLDGCSTLSEYQIL